MSRARARSAPNTDINLEAGVGGKSESGASAWGSSTWGESTWGTPAGEFSIFSHLMEAQCQSDKFNRRC